MYQGNDRKGLGDTASKSTAGKPAGASVSTRRSSVTSIKSFTAMLPAVLEAVESELSSFDSVSAINIKVDSSSEKYEDTSMKKLKVVQKVVQNSSIKSENESKDDDSREINREIGTEDIEHKLSSSYPNSTPTIQIDKCTDVTEPIYAARYQRRMSKSCDQLDVKIKSTNNSKWKSWSDILSSINNSISRVKHGLSSSISHISTMSDEPVNNQIDNAPEETQLVDDHSERTAETDEDIDGTEPIYDAARFQRRMSKSCDQLDANMNENLTNTNKNKWKSLSNFFSSIKKNNSTSKVKCGRSVSNIENPVYTLTIETADNPIDKTLDEIQPVDDNHSETIPEDTQDQNNLAE